MLTFWIHGQKHLLISGRFFALRRKPTSWTMKVRAIREPSRLVDRLVFVLDTYIIFLNDKNQAPQ